MYKRQGLVHARDRSPAAAGGESRLHLVPVMVGVFHAQNGRNLAEGGKQPLYPRLLPGKLAGVFHILQLAATTFFCKRAGARICRSHSISLIPGSSAAFLYTM